MDTERMNFADRRWIRLRSIPSPPLLLGCGEPARHLGDRSGCGSALRVIVWLRRSVSLSASCVVSVDGVWIPRSPVAH
jgi:hypothetical protein